MKKKHNPDSPAPEDRIFSASLTRQSVEREVKRFELQERFDARMMEADMRFGLTANTFMDHAARQMILQLKAVVASKKFDVKTVRYPASAWDHFKESAREWCRGCGLHRFAKFIESRGVRYVEVTMEANAYHPDIAIPDHDTYVNIAVSAKYHGDR